MGSMGFPCSVRSMGLSLARRGVSNASGALQPDLQLPLLMKHASSCAFLSHSSCRHDETCIRVLFFLPFSVVLSTSNSLLGCFLSTFSISSFFLVIESCRCFHTGIHSSRYIVHGTYYARPTMRDDACFQHNTHTHTHVAKRGVWGGTPLPGPGSHVGLDPDFSHTSPSQLYQIRRTTKKKEPKGNNTRESSYHASTDTHLLSFLLSLFYFILSLLSMLFSPRVSHSNGRH